MIDATYKFCRRVIPSWIYDILGRTPLRRTAAFENNQAYDKIFEVYQSSLKTTFKDKVILEIGSGNQIRTAQRFLEAGAHQVILAEPRIEIKEEVSNTRILKYRYISELPESLVGSIDLIFSHQVLEHIPDLDTFFADLSRLLALGGQSFHRVDLSDHTYHIFDKFSCLHGFVQNHRLRHLEYSNRLFRLLNDPKSPMNRRLFPEYRKLAKRDNLSVSFSNILKAGFAHIHPDILGRIGFPPKNEELSIFAFDMELMNLP